MALCGGPFGVETPLRTILPPNAVAHVRNLTMHTPADQAWGILEGRITPRLNYWRHLRVTLQTLDGNRPPFDQMMAAVVLDAQLRARMLEQRPFVAVVSTPQNTVGVYSLCTASL